MHMQHIVHCILKNVEQFVTTEEAGSARDGFYHELNYYTTLQAVNFSFKQCPTLDLQSLEIHQQIYEVNHSMPSM